MVRCIVAGGRNFMNYGLLCKELDHLLASVEKDKTKITILCGKARGADALGERYAKEHGLKIEYFPANWETYGVPAGFIRNEEMAKTATHLVAFWDGYSKGTQHMIRIAEKYKLSICVIGY